MLREQPANVTELVTLTGRAQSNISRSLQLLAKHRLIRLVREGREIRPEAIAKSVRVDLLSGTYETTPISKVAATQKQPLASAECRQQSGPSIHPLSYGAKNQDNNE